ncbi:hypothetical protein [Gorillibacterium timonense]|uniref:hypothetical protein n=1 Tax=Gorillibacterium timonense TaxID=1689269 RepID=UPI000AAED2E6|nr:hypothetical protein [Gorillibacterium timonense]
MKKQWSRTEYAFVMSFIFMLVCVAVAFFYGFLTGTDKVEAKYKTLLAEKNDPLNQAGAYDQTSLASYYHLAYLPYEDFRAVWFDNLNALESASSGKESSSLLEQIRKQAKSSFDRIGEGTMPEHSPLLNDAHTHLLKSLKLFSQEIAKYETDARSTDGSKLVVQMNKDAGLTEAKRFAMQAQEEYFAAILQWNMNAVPGMKHSELLKEKSISLKNWSLLSLNQKNMYLAKALAAAPLFTNYAPQDLTAQIDMLITEGHTDKMKLTNVQDAIDLLSATGAVRDDDFSRLKAKRYPNETLPLIPFFS